ncbi:hypothetical protein E3N88_43648 [Mikania micrantha]|uniref:Uncharacterized protein n=1 Tax=Mikania micrantha TaxID=192012 RepID=A0A5N6LEC4_9ASTR|nr:hypothetical protein E3N88_43648 [Mikania micrantha]
MPEELVRVHIRTCEGDKHDQVFLDRRNQEAVSYKQLPEDHHVKMHSERIVDEAARLVTARANISRELLSHGMMPLLRGIGNGKAGLGLRFGGRYLGGGLAELVESVEIGADEMFGGGTDGVGDVDVGRVVSGEVGSVGVGRNVSVVVVEVGSDRSGSIG